MENAGCPIYSDLLVFQISLGLLPRFHVLSETPGQAKQPKGYN